MTPQELKASILQLAIQGKLVEQLTYEDSVDIEGSFSGDTSDFFEIPDKWKWLSIKDVASVNTGLSFKKQDQRDSSNGSLRVLRGGNIGDDYKYHLYEDDVYVNLDQFYTKYIKLIAGDIITPSVTSMEKICKTGFVDRDLPTITAGGFVYIIRCLDRSVVDPKYLLYFISSFFNKEQCKPNIHKSGQAFYNLKKSGFIEQPICVPPLAEQKRIVAKIEELLPLIDRYEQAWSKLEDFNKRFPVDMQKSILQMAIQGKLVPQLPEEGTGEELLKILHAEKDKIVKSGVLKGRKTKPLQKVSADDIPFEIPDTWCWIRLGNVAEIFGRIGFRGYTKNDIVPAGEGAITISPSNIRPNGKTDFSDCTYLSWEKYEESPEIKVFEGDILLVKTGSSYGKCGIVCDLPEKATINPQLAILKYVTCDVTYLDYALKSPLARSQFESFVIGTSIPTFSQEKLANLLLPLPPLVEQKRIVAKLEEILPLCERLK